MSPYIITGKGYTEIKDVLPEDIQVACHNSADSCTLSGPAQSVESYVEELKKKDVFARAVNVANIAYHSKYIAPIAPQLICRLKEVRQLFVILLSVWFISENQRFIFQ